MASLFDPAHTFVETGTYEGKTLRRAAESGMYERVVSIEIDRALYEHVTGEFWPDCVEIYWGDSPKILNEVLDPEVVTLIFLDAHRTGRGGGKFTAHGSNGECPVLAELEAIVSKPWRTWPTIKIHDARMFLGNNGFWGSKAAKRFDEMQWPTETNILDAVPGYCMDHDETLDTLILRRSV